jgi:phosphonate transport system substrate-binding protein
MRRRSLAICALLLGCCWIIGVAASQQSAGAAETAQGLRLGSVAMDIPAVMYKRLQPLTEYLSGVLQRDVTLHLSPDMPAAIEATAGGEVDLAYLTPVAYLKAHEQGNASLVVKTITNGRGSFQLMIVVREGSDIQRVEDLAGKRFAFGDRAALLQRAVVVQAGMPIESLGEVQYLGHYDNIVRAVINGDFDAGILKDTMAYKWQGKGIRILHASEHLPPYNIAARKGLDAGLLEKIRQAFLDLDPDNPGHLAIIKSLDRRYDGFLPTSDAEYDVVRRLVRPFGD